MTIAITGFVCLILGLILGAELSGVQLRSPRELMHDAFRSRLAAACGIEPLAPRECAVRRKGE